MQALRCNVRLDFSTETMPLRRQPDSLEDLGELGSVDGDMAVAVERLGKSEVTPLEPFVPQHELQALRTWARALYA